MSRSFKRNPILKDNKNGRKLAKRQANKKVRRHLKDNFNLTLRGKLYRKIYNSYDIYDYISRCSKEESRYYNFKDNYDWEKYYYWK